ncbi:MAG: DUF4176 domain-containing protein [Cystobacterineae bacterium]|nr:DUF4176 domain-containing protein [Cystobacterineae bacterium]
MADKYLPIGSVVLLEEATKALMVYGRQQRDTGTGETYDYVACLYPEGNIGKEHTYLFNADKIAKVLFVGFDSEENKELTNKLQAQEQMPSRLSGHVSI